MSTPTGGGGKDPKKPGSNAPGRGHGRELLRLQNRARNDTNRERKKAKLAAQQQIPKVKMPFERVVRFPSNMQEEPLLIQ